MYSRSAICIAACAPIPNPAYAYRRKFKLKAKLATSSSKFSFKRLTRALSAYVSGPFNVQAPTEAAFSIATVLSPPGRTSRSSLSLTSSTLV